MFGFAVLAQAILNIAEIRHIDASSLQALQRAEDSARAIASALRRAQASPFEHCSDADLNVLRNIAYANSFVADLGRLDADEVRCTAMWGRLENRSRLPVPHYETRGHKIWTQEDPLKTHYLSTMVALQNSLAIASPNTFDLNRFYQDVSLRVTNQDETHLYAERGSQRYNPEGAMLLLPEVMLRQCSAEMNLCARARARLHWHALAYPGSFLAVLLAGFVTGVLGCLLHLRGRRTHGVIEKLRAGIDHGDIALVYQPIVGVSDLRLKGFEALARWRPQTEPEIGPEVFVPLAVQNRLSTALAKAVLERAVREMRPALDAHPELILSINAEVADIEDHAFVAHALDLTADHPALRRQLHLEVTERAEILSVTFRRHIELLKQGGFALWIDDFGTGSANLSHLSYAQFDGIKIDRLFTSALSTTSPLRSVVPNLLRLADELGLQVVIEGIENDEQLQFVRDIAPQTHAQGWLFSKPLELAAALARVNAQGQHHGTASTP